MKSESTVMVVVADSVSIIQHRSQDRTLSQSWSLARLGMVKRWTLLHSRMPSSISSHLLTRVVLSYMCPQEHGWPKVSILLVIWHSSWKKAQSFLDLRYFTFCFFFDSLLSIVLFTEDISLFFIFLLFFFFNVILVLVGSVSVGSCWSITFLW